MDWDINPKALERFMRAFDFAIAGRCGLSPGQPSPALTKERLFELVQQSREKQWQLELEHRPRHRFRLLNILRTIRDDIRLRKYNEKYTKSLH